MCSRFASPRLPKRCSVSGPVSCASHFRLTSSVDFVRSSLDIRPFSFHPSSLSGLPGWARLPRLILFHSLISSPVPSPSWRASYHYSSSPYSTRSHSLLLPIRHEHLSHIIEVLFSWWASLYPSFWLGSVGRDSRVEIVDHHSVARLKESSNTAALRSAYIISY